MDNLKGQTGGSLFRRGELKRRHDGGGHIDRRSGYGGEHLYEECAFRLVASNVWFLPGIGRRGVP